MIDRSIGEGVIVDPSAPPPKEIVDIVLEAARPKVADSGMDYSWAKVQLQKAGLRATVLRYLDTTGDPAVRLYGPPRGYFLESVGAWEAGDLDLKRGNPQHLLSATREEALERFSDIFEMYPAAFMIDVSEH